MKNNRFNNGALKFLSYLKQSDFTLIISSFEDSKIRQFYHYLMCNSHVIYESEEHKILNILETCKNQNVFIYEPMNQWILDIPKYSSSEDFKTHTKSKYYSTLIRKIRNFTFNNGIKIVAKSLSYNTPNKSAWNNSGNVSIFGGSAPFYISDFVLNYNDGTFFIPKNRFDTDMKSINVKELNFLYREEKLKRILK